MKISKIAKIAAVAIAFGLVATTPVYAAGQSGEVQLLQTGRIYATNIT